MTFIISEIGSNWKTLDHCYKSIEAAAEAGADAVKFQLYNSEALYGRPDVPLEGVLPPEWLPSLQTCAERNNIEFMCTAFSPKLLQVVNPFVVRHKIASAENEWYKLIHDAIKTVKPVIISCGGLTDEAEKKLRAHFCDKRVGGVRPKLSYLYCVANYPATDVDLGWLSHYDGFSDHTIGFGCAMIAARFVKTKILEKHMTAFPDIQTPDRRHSIPAQEFKIMADLIRDRPSRADEPDMIRWHKRRLADGKMVRLVPGE